MSRKIRPENIPGIQPRIPDIVRRVVEIDPLKPWPDPPPNVVPFVKPVEVEKENKSVKPTDLHV